MMKKLLAIIAAAVATSATIPAFADTWTDPDTGIEWTYTVTDGRAFLGGGTYQTPAVANSAVDIAIPDTIDVYPVGGISAYGFYNFPNLTNIVISSSIESIGSSAFSFCRKLKTVEIPGSVIEIGRDAFYACYGLEEVVLNEGLREIGAYAFQNDYSLDEITIPNSVTNIQSLAFYGTSIRRVVIGTGVGKIGSGAFGRCQNLTDVVFLGGRDAIDMTVADAFVGTPWLESLDFSLEIKNNRVVGFLGVCPATVTIPEGVTEIGGSAFSAPSVTNLVSIVLPESLDIIRYNAFDGCCNLQSIYIPENVWSIYNAFQGCVSLSNVTFGREDWLDSYDMSVFYGTPFFDTLPFRLQTLRRMEEGWEHDRYYISGYIGKCPDNLDIEAIWAADWERQRQRVLEEWGEDIGEAPAIAGIDARAFIGSGISSVILPAGLVEIGERILRLHEFDACCFHWRCTGGHRRGRILGLR